MPSPQKNKIYYRQFSFIAPRTVVFQKTQALVNPLIIQGIQLNPRGPQWRKDKHGNTLGRVGVGRAKRRKWSHEALVSALQKNDSSKWGVGGV